MSQRIAQHLECPCGDADIHVEQGKDPYSRHAEYREAALRVAKLAEVTVQEWNNRTEEDPS